VAIGAYLDMAARFSAMAQALGDTLAEIDINPVIVSPDGAAAADALVVGRAPGNPTTQETAA